MGGLLSADGKISLIRHLSRDILEWARIVDDFALGETKYFQRLRENRTPVREKYFDGQHKAGNDSGPWETP